MAKISCNLMYITIFFGRLYVTIYIVMKYMLLNKILLNFCSGLCWRYRSVILLFYIWKFIRLFSSDCIGYVFMFIGIIILFDFFNYYLSRLFFLFLHKISFCSCNLVSNILIYLELFNISYLFPIFYWNYVFCDHFVLLF